MEQLGDIPWQLLGDSWEILSATASDIFGLYCDRDFFVPGLKGDRPIHAHAYIHPGHGKR